MGGVGATISVFVLFGMLWKAGAVIDKHWVKVNEASVIHEQMQTIDEQMKNDIALLGSSFEYDQLDRAIERKRDKINDLNRELSRPGLTEREKTTLKQQIKDYENEVDSLLKKQEYIMYNNPQQQQKRR
jgi:hypothetical protein